MDDATYRKLLLKYHPDHNSSPSAARHAATIIALRKEYLNRQESGTLRPIPSAIRILGEKDGVLFLDGATVYPANGALPALLHSSKREVAEKLDPLLPHSLALSHKGKWLTVRHAERLVPLPLVSWTDPRDTAWILSSLLNMCCFLTSVGKVCKQLTASCFALDPAKHDVHLIGGWGQFVDEGMALSPVTPLLYSMLPFAVRRDKCAHSCVNVVQVKSLLPLTGIAPFDAFLTEPSSLTAYAAYADWQNHILPASFRKREFFKGGLTMKYVNGMPADDEDDTKGGK